MLHDSALYKSITDIDIDAMVPTNCATTTLMTVTQVSTKQHTDTDCISLSVNQDTLETVDQCRRSKSLYRLSISVGEASWQTPCVRWSLPCVEPTQPSSPTSHQPYYDRHKPFNLHIKTTEQRTIIQQYSDWYTGCWWVGCYIWYCEEGTG